MTRFNTAALVFGLLAAAAAAAAPTPAELPQGGDPYLPPALRRAPTQTSPSGAALQAKVEQKLRETFDAADIARSASLTREQAARAGWAMVIQEFDRIDTARNGRVSFEDITRFVRARNASR